MDLNPNEPPGPAIDAVLTLIARKELGMPTLQARRSDSLDFRELSVWQVRDALRAAFDAGRASTQRGATAPALEVTKDNGVTWLPCEVIGRHAQVECIPVFLPPHHGYLFAHPQCLRYADTRRTVYSDPARLSAAGA